MNHYLLFTLLLAPQLLRSAEDAETNPNQLVRKCAEQMNKSVRLESSYTYKFLDETKNLDRNGAVKETHRKLVEIVYFAGKPNEHLLEKDGKPLPASEQKHEEEKMNHAASEAAKLTDEQRETRQAKLDHEREKDNEWLQYIPRAYNFSTQPAVDLNGRPTYVLNATPKEDYRGKYAGMLRKTKAKLFIDQADYTLARVEAEVLEPITFGLFLGRLSEGTRISFEQLRINDEIWLPKTATVHANARALVKTYRIDERLVFSDYRKFQSDSRIVPVSDK